MTMTRPLLLLSPLLVLVAVPRSSAFVVCTQTSFGQHRSLVLRGGKTGDICAVDSLHSPLVCAASPRVQSPPRLSHAETRSHQQHAETHSDDRRVYFIMGGPGSGKGTQCELLARQFGMTHLSAGDLLRQEVRSESKEGKAIAQIIREGKIVASETTVALLQNAMAKSPGPYLIDGFPRSLSNMQAFEELVGQPQFMLFLDVSEEEMLCRLRNRGLSSGRTDDNEETIRKRFRTFLDDSMPVVQLFQNRGILRRIDAQASMEAVFERICNAFADQHLAQADMHAEPELPPAPSGVSVA